MPKNYMPRNRLLERLREGPVCTDDWSTIASSRKSLQVQVFHLRERGHVIESRINPRPGAAKRVTYHLLKELEKSA